MSEFNTPVYAYLFGDDDNRIVTLAYTVEKAGDDTQTQDSYVAIVGHAICGPYDQHEKARGRQIALGRYEHPDAAFVVDLGQEIKRRKRLNLIVDFLAQKSNTLGMAGGRILSQVAQDEVTIRPLIAVLRSFDPETSQSQPWPF